jgi:ABC-type antimicrobial peptide transport system permease subunit
MIEPKTYVIAMAGTLIIALASSWYLAGKLKKIDMVTSLKANE